MKVYLKYSVALASIWLENFFKMSKVPEIVEVAGGGGPEKCREDLGTKIQVTVLEFCIII